MADEIKLNAFTIDQETGHVYVEAEVLGIVYGHTYPSVSRFCEECAGFVTSAQDGFKMLTAFCLANDPDASEMEGNIGKTLTIDCTAAAVQMQMSLLA